MSAKNLIGRDSEIDTFREILDGRRVERLVRVSGVPGIGKSRLLKQFVQEGSERGWTIGLVDLYTLRSSPVDISLPVAITETVLRLLLPALPSNLKGERRKEYDSAVSVAERSLAAARPSLNVKQVATLGGHIDNITIDLHDSEVAELAASMAFRRAVLEALLNALRGVDMSRCLLSFDTCETLALLGSNSDAGAETSIARWFEVDVIGGLLAHDAGPVVVVAAGEPMCVGHPNPSVAFALVEWSDSQSTEFGIQMGLPDTVSQQLRQFCGGLPLWNSLVAEEWLRRRPGNADASWFLQAATLGPVEEWLPRVFLDRIPNADQDALTAASVLRDLTFESVESVANGLSRSRWESLISYSFVQTVAGVDGVQGRRVHSLFARSIQAYLRRDRPRLLRTLHGRAAEYFKDIGVEVEEHYHRFAAGDWSTLDAWQEKCETLLDEYEFEKLLLLLSATDAVIEGVAALRDSPRLRGLYHETRARLASRRDLLDEAIELAEAAAQCYEESDALGDHADALDMLARLHFRIGAYESGMEYLRRAYRMARAANDGGREGRELQRLAMRETDPGEKARYQQEALEAYRRDGDAHREADMLRRLGDLETEPSKRRDLYVEAAAVFAADDACQGGKGEAEEGLARLAVAEGDLQHAKSHLDNAVTIFAAAGAHDNRGKSLRSLAYLALMRDDFYAAQSYFEDALLAFRNAKNMVEVAATHQSIAEATADYLGMSRALDALESARSTYATIGDIHGMSSVMEALGSLHARQRRWPLEKGPLLQALQGYRSCRDVKAQIRVLRALAASCGVFSAVAEIMFEDVSLDRKLEALDYATRAHDLSASESPRNIADLALVIGKLHLYMRQFEPAREFLVRSAGLLDGFEQQEERARVWREVAAMDYAEGSPLDAIITCRSAIDSLDEERFGKFLAYLYQDLGDYYSAVGKMPEAESSYEHSRTLFDLF